MYPLLSHDLSQLAAAANSASKLVGNPIPSASYAILRMVSMLWHFGQVLFFLPFDPVRDTADMGVSCVVAGLSCVEFLS